MPEQPKVKIGVLVALQQELNTLIRTKEITSGKTVYRVADHMQVRLTGMGDENAQKAAQELVADGFGLLISWGTAAALGVDLAPGMLCIPKFIIEAGGKKININSKLQTLILRKLDNKIPLITTPLAESPHLLATRDEKQRLYQKTHAAAADMESRAILRVARQHNIPFLAIRAISDSHEARIPRTVVHSSDKNEMNMLHLLQQLAITPSDWLPIIQLALGFRKAKKTLANTAQLLVPLLSNEAESVI